MLSRLGREFSAEDSAGWCCEPRRAWRCSGGPRPTSHRNSKEIEILYIIYCKYNVYTGDIIIYIFIYLCVCNIYIYIYRCVWLCVCHALGFTRNHNSLPTPAAPCRPSVQLLQILVRRGCPSQPPEADEASAACSRAVPFSPAVKKWVDCYNL